MDRNTIVFYSEKTARTATTTNQVRQKKVYYHRNDSDGRVRNAFDEIVNANVRLCVHTYIVHTFIVIRLSPQ